MPRQARKWFCRALVLAALLGKPGYSQSHADTVASNPEKPSVFVSFDHVVRPALPRRDNDSGLLYLRIRNNSRAPIRVLATPPEAGAEDVELMHEIIPARIRGASSGSTEPESVWISPPDRYLLSDAATTVDIQPGADLLFSVPINHVGPSWFLRLTFQFVQSKIRSGRQPESHADFTWADVPKNERPAWRKDSAK